MCNSYESFEQCCAQLTQHPEQLRRSGIEQLAFHSNTFYIDTERLAFYSNTFYIDIARLATHSNTLYIDTARLATLFLILNLIQAKIRNDTCFHNVFGSLTKHSLKCNPQCFDILSVHIAFFFCI